MNPENNRPRDPVVMPNGPAMLLPREHQLASLMGKLALRSSQWSPYWIDVLGRFQRDEGLSPGDALGLELWMLHRDCDGWAAMMKCSKESRGGDR